jgi:hypothetical protein
MARLAGAMAQVVGAEATPLRELVGVRRRGARRAGRVDAAGVQQELRVRLDPDHDLRRARV